jgi:hypothetical protein
MSMTENPRAVIGDNRAQSAAENVKIYLERDYAHLFMEVDLLLTDARAAPREVRDDEVATAMGSLIKRLRELDGRIEAVRETEKAPHRMAADAVDAVCFPLREKLARRNPRDLKQKPGAADILQARLSDYLERKRLEEEARREAEAARLAAEARARQEEEARARRVAEEAAASAERARNAERIAEKSALAKVEAERAAAAAVEAEVARQAAQEAHIATLAKPAEMSRTRGDGVLLTQAREGYAILADRSAITAEAAMALLPYFTDAELEKAARGFAKATNHGKPLVGFEIGFRRKGVTR